MNAIQVDNLTKRYGDVLAVDGISFTAPAGATVGLLGGNGAGKTTTIAMLLGLLVPTSGRITVLGHDMAKDRFTALARMNFSSPYVALPSRLTVRENMRVYGHLYNVPQRRSADRRAWHANWTSAAILDRPAGQLSAGQKTRVALAKALINRPEVLLLDEPTASLDPDTGDLVRTWLEQYRARKRLHHSAGQPQHGRGGTALLRRGDAETGAGGRSRQPGRAADALRPSGSGGRVPRHRPRSTAGGGGMKPMFRRIWGLMYRHLALYRRSWPRLLELAYWPVLQDVHLGLHRQLPAARGWATPRSWPAPRCWAACCCGR